MTWTHEETHLTPMEAQVPACAEPCLQRQAVARSPTHTRARQMTSSQQPFPEDDEWGMDAPSRRGTVTTSPPPADKPAAPKTATPSSAPAATAAAAAPATATPAATAAKATPPTAKRRGLMAPKGGPAPPCGSCSNAACSAGGRCVARLAAERAASAVNFGLLYWCGRQKFVSRLVTFPGFL
jgi:hypothetical protein